MVSDCWNSEGNCCRDLINTQSLTNPKQHCVFTDTHKSSVTGNKCFSCSFWSNDLFGDIAPMKVNNYFVANSSFPFMKSAGWNGITKTEKYVCDEISVL